MNQCRICGKKIDGRLGIYCSRCDKLIGDANADLAAELGGTK
jgi:hypothetical protein